jgi:RNA polymerase sigma-70 factor (ECF subfamily)
MSECNNEQKKWDRTVRAVCSGDVDRFRAIIEGFQETLRFSIAFHIRNDADLIDEIVHRSFIRAFRGLHTFTPGKPLGPWLKQIAKHEALNEMRRIGREAKLKKDLIRCAIAEAREDREAPVEQLHLLRRCMELLREKSRNLVEMHYFKKMTMKAIGKAVNRSPGAIRAAMLSIRRILRTCIEKETVND